jgi:hypothetical protein
MEYRALQCFSERGSHPILLYQSRIDPARWLKFCHKHKNKDDYSYNCMGCKQAYIDGNPMSIKSVHVNLGYTAFLDDPEAILHECIELNYMFGKLDMALRKLYRFVLLEFLFRNNVTSFYLRFYC